LESTNVVSFTPVPNEVPVVTAGAAFIPPIAGVVDAILKVGRERNALLDKMRAALEKGNDCHALNLARQLCGLSTQVPGIELVTI
jgi:hypothetical protein